MIWLTLGLVAAFAGNDRSFTHGSEASITAGAGVAVTRDAEAIWYNPAGLGGVDRTKINLSGTAFMLRARHVDPFLSTRLGNRIIDIESSATTLVSVPTAVGMVRRASPRISWGVGIYVTRQDRVNLLLDHEVDVTLPDGAAGTYVQSLQVGLDQQQYQIGPAFGWKVSERVRLGWALFGMYERTQFSQSFLANIQAADDEVEALSGYVTSDDASTFNTLALTTTFGVQIDVSDAWHLAFVLRSPSFTVYRWGKEASTLATGGSSPDAQPNNGVDYASSRTDAWGARLLDPMSLQLAVGVTYPNWWFGAEGTLTFPNSEVFAGSPRTWLGNASVGLRARATPKLWWGVGLFTDLSPNVREGAYADRLDYFGITTGPDIHTPVQLGPASKPLVFTTTFGVRYAVGVGPYGTILFDPFLAAQNATGLLGFEMRNVVFHEVSVQLGSTLHF